MVDPSKQTVSIPHEQYEELHKKFLSVCVENERLREELATIKRMLFGQKRERFIPNDDQQLSIFAPQQETLVEPEPQKQIVERNKPKKKGKAVRMELPSSLPRKEEVIEPADLPQQARKIGQEVTEVLEIEPAKVSVRRIVRPKYALPFDQGVVIAPLPDDLPLPRANAAASTLAHISVAKFVDHLPWYRINKQLKRSKLFLAESTLQGWFKQSCELLTPLYEALRKQVSTCSYLQMDESPIKVLDKDKPGATHQGYMWVVYAPELRLVLFEYAPSRAGKVAAGLLEGFKGTLQTDGYSGYDRFEQQQDLLLVACMAHIRRKFDQALDNDRQRASHVLKQIGLLYQIEQRARQEHMTAEQRQALRDKEAAPIFTDLHQWLDKQYDLLTPKSSIAKAVSYALQMFPRMENYLKDGQIEIDNNPIENTIRPLALGRKNYLFAGNHQAAQRNALMYSLMGSCLQNNADPYHWLTNTLQKINNTKVNELNKLLPNNTLESHKV
jgi:transposase